ncbi:MAG: Twin-arginine translocation pathway signal [Acidobacteria bacterium]|nr:MAG: Twin-arginine translocation pathway signal [Acidobacteriota bacterium]
MPSLERLSRRNFLGIGAIAAAGALLPARAVAAAAAATAIAAVSTAADRSLSFFHTHTNERLTTAYCCNGEYVSKELIGVNHLLRDFRMNEIKAIDPRLLDLLFELNNRLGTDQPFHVISGYRTPETNAMLNERGGAQSGVAAHSLHIEGKAIDIRVPGIKLEHLRDTAKALRVGGVGYYRASNFVHVDTGRIRYW